MTSERCCLCSFSPPKTSSLSPCQRFAVWPVHVLRACKGREEALDHRLTHSHAGDIAIIIYQIPLAGCKVQAKDVVVHCHDEREIGKQTRRMAGQAGYSPSSVYWSKPPKAYI